MIDRKLPLPNSGKAGSKMHRKYGINYSTILKATEKMLECESVTSMKEEARKLTVLIENEKIDERHRLKGNCSERSYLNRELNQIEEAQTLERGKYYIKRLIKSLTSTKTNGINDININRWKEYEEILTDSFWSFKRRDNSGAHLGWYWGNFIPQIPHQMISRYTRKGDWVLDPFAGSGTTLIECKRLGRNGFGVELNDLVAEKGNTLVDKEKNKFSVRSYIINADSAAINFNQMLMSAGISRVQLIIMHPPYYDIIKFSSDSRDLSNAPSVDKFLEMLGTVVERTYPILEDGRYLVLVIGDKYYKGEWIPLGFRAMNLVAGKGYTLTSIIVKNFEDTRAKRNQKELWRYRALLGGFYVFKHEYIFIFKKKQKRKI